MQEKFKRKKYVCQLKNITRESINSAGGKGANLGAMIRADLPVPPGFVVLTQAYRKFCRDNEITEKIKQLLAEFSDDAKENLPAIKALSEKIKALFLNGQISPGLQQEISEMYNSLSDQDNPAVAVRSSATVEDLPGSSFAGQYDSYLNVRGQAELLEKITECWASLWNSRALDYRLKQGIDNQGIAHGVVVQRLIKAEKSGILFTANPLNNRRDQLLLNSSWGLGEAVVGGEVTPDQWIIDKVSGKFISKEIARKEKMAVMKKQGIEYQKIPAEQQQKSSLTAGEVNRLYNLGKKAEDYFDSPQDIEWAWEGDSLYLVQTRPITSLYPLPESCQPATDNEEFKVYLNFNLQSQGMQEPFTPLGGDIFKQIICGQHS